jgi:large subunit ribosomal protein L15
MILNDVHRGITKNKKRKRLGRGPGSGHGKTAGRGHKGQGSRSGVSKLSIFVGGQTPLVRRIPKRGFFNRFGQTVAVVNVGQLDQAFAAGEEVTIESLAAKNLAKGRFDVLKILGDGELTKKLKIHAHKFSKSAEEKIAKSGSEKIVLPGKISVAEKQGKRGSKKK